MVDAASRIAREPFGRLPDGRAVERVVLRGMHGFEAGIITYGATLQALIVPDAAQRCDDVVLGYDDLAGYLDMRKFFGATVGRYANRIGGARETFPPAVVGDDSDRMCSRRFVVFLCKKAAQRGLYPKHVEIIP